MSAGIGSPLGNKGGTDVGAGLSTARLQDDALFERLCRDPGSLYAEELESLIPEKVYGLLRGLKELFRSGGLFHEVTVTPRGGACRLVLTTKCTLYEPHTGTTMLPDAYVGRAVAELLDRWSTGRCVTRRRCGDR